MSKISYSLELNMKEMLKTTAVLIISVIFGYCGRYLVNLLLARHLSAGLYGDYACLINVVFIGAIILLIGAADVVNKYIPVFILERSWSKAFSFLRSQIRVILLIFFVVFILGGIVFIALFILDHLHYYTILEYHPVIFAFWFAPLFALITYQAKLLQSIRRIYFSLLSFKVLPFLLMIFGITLFLQEESKIAMFQVLGVYGIALSAVAFFQFILLIYSLPKELFQHKTKEQPISWMKTSAMMMLTGFIFTGIQVIDLLMLELLGPNEAEVGLFAAIITICGCFAVIPVAFGPLINPLINIFFQEKDNALLQKFSTKYNLIALIFLVLELVIVTVFGKTILSYFGVVFVSGSSLLIILAPFAFLLAFANVIADPLLKYTGKQNYLVIVTAIGALITIFCDALLMPFYGMYGVILGVALSRIFIVIAIVFGVRMHLGIKGLIWI